MSRVLATYDSRPWPAAAALALALALSACVAAAGPAPTAPAAPAPATTDFTLSLHASIQTGSEVAVDLQYFRDPAKPGARMMELALVVTGTLQYLRAERLAAAEAAGKELIVQAREDGTLRTLLFTTANTTRLASGPLCRLWFARGGTGTVALLDESPIFAPPDADEAVVLGQPLSVVAGGGSP